MERNRIRGARTATNKDVAFEQQPSRESEIFQAQVDHEEKVDETCI